MTYSSVCSLEEDAGCLPLLLFAGLCVRGRLGSLVIVLEGDLGGGLGFLAIVLEGDLDLNSCFFYYWQTDQVGSNTLKDTISVDFLVKIHF